MVKWISMNSVEVSFSKTNRGNSFLNSSSDNLFNALSTTTIISSIFDDNSATGISFSENYTGLFLIYLVFPNLAPMQVFKFPSKCKQKFLAELAISFWIFQISLSFWYDLISVFSLIKSCLNTDF